MANGLHKVIFSYINCLEFTFSVIIWRPLLTLTPVYQTDRTVVLKCMLPVSSESRATGESIYRIQHTSRFMINDILKATHLALTSTSSYCYYSFVLSTELFYTVQVMKFLHVN